MESGTDTTIPREDRTLAATNAAAAESKQTAADRRMAPRTKASKVGKIVLGTGASVDCTLRDISATGAVLEVQDPLQQKTFDIVFDGDEWPRRSCRVVWEAAPRLGVEFLTMGALLDGYNAARQRRDAQIAERHRKEKTIDHELHEVARLMSQAAKFLQDNEVTSEIVNRTLRVAHKRAPVIAVHYDPEHQEYRTTFMLDASHATAKSPDECAKAIGELLFAILTPA